METFSEQLSRVELMADGDPTWDLSDNDTAALKAVLKDYRRLAQASRPAPPLSRSDIDEIVVAIKVFVIGDDDELKPVWQPSIDKLRALKATIPDPEIKTLASRPAPPEGQQTCWTCLGTGEDADTDGAGSWTRIPCGTCDGTGYIPIKAESRPAPPLDWQSIATAPKDGTPILVNFGSAGIHRVFWSDEPFGPGIGCWCVTDLKNEDKPLRRYVDKDIKGWMPLPAPPAAHAAKIEE